MRPGRRSRARVEQEDRIISCPDLPSIARRIEDALASRQPPDTELLAAGRRHAQQLRAAGLADHARQLADRIAWLEARQCHPVE